MRLSAGLHDASATRSANRATLPTLVAVASLVAVVSSLGAPLIPSIARTYNVPLSSAQWLLTAALTTGAVATPAMGRLADGPRKRQVIEFALAVTLSGCVLSALAESFPLLVAGRALQGVGLGLLPVTMAIARSELPTASAVRAIASLSVAAAVGAGLGYPITSLIADLSSFRGAFWFGAITVGLALALVMAVLPKRCEGRAKTFDFVGMIALAVAVAGVSLVLSEGDQWGWTSLPCLGLGAACLAITAYWVRHELRTPEPLIDVRQVTNRAVLTADISGFLVATAMYLFLPIVIEFVQVPVASGYGLGISILVSGVVFVPLSATSFTASRCLSAYSRRFGTRTTIPFGSVVFGIAAAFFALAHSSLWEAFVASAIAGIGIGFTFAAMPGFIVRAVAREETGSATGFYQVLRSIGLSVGSALAAAILAAYTKAGQTYPSFGGFRTTLLISIAICAATAVVSYLLPGPARVEPEVEADRAPKPPTTIEPAPKILERPQT